MHRSTVEKNASSLAHRNLPFLCKKITVTKTEFRDVNALIGGRYYDLKNIFAEKIGVFVLN
jgi:hypothetical protein